MNTIVAKLGCFTQTTVRDVGLLADTTEWTHHYLVHPVVFARPEKGHMTVAVTCKICGHDVNVRVASRKAELGKRIGVAGIPIVLLALWFLFLDAIAYAFISVLLIIFVIIMVAMACSSDPMGFAVTINRGDPHRIFKREK